LSIDRLLKINWFCANVLFIFLCFSCLSLSAQDLDAMIERIKPVGRVCIRQTSEPEISTLKKEKQFNLGRTIFEGKCMLCHGHGVAGAPTLTDKQAWAPRISQGKAILLDHVQQGYKAMPAKGACFECSTDDLKAAIAYLIDVIKK
jgi:cytochrome c5